MFKSSLDRLLSFSFLPLSLGKDKLSSLRSPNTFYKSLLSDGILDMRSCLDDNVKQEVIHWIEKVSQAHSRDSLQITTRVYDVHKHFSVPPALLSSLTPILDYYFQSRNWILDQTQWQYSIPGSTPPGYGWHIDSFYPSLKLFIYQGPVSTDNGPMSYVTASHKTPKGLLRRLRWSITRELKLTYFPTAPHEPILSLTSSDNYSYFLCDMRGYHSSTTITNGSRTVLVLNFRKRYPFL